jgi:AraC-like DNA-binding protein
VVAGLALAGSISLEAAATRLGISRRTLQRRLNRHGVNFWTLVEERRFEIAAALLRETDLKVQEIAARMGYSTPSGFARAFAKWAGLSPTRFRRVPKKPEPRNVRLARNGQKDRT